MTPDEARHEAAVRAWRSGHMVIGRHTPAGWAFEEIEPTAVIGANVEHRPKMLAFEPAAVHPPRRPWWRRLLGR